MTVRPRRPRRAVIGFLLTAVMVTVGCADGTGSGTSRTPLSPLSSAPPLAGAPVKVMTWGSTATTSAVAFPDLPAIGQAFADTLNAQGGINGRPLQVIACDERGEPEAAEKCARRAVDEGVVAVVGAFSLHGDRYQPVLQAAGIAYLGGAPMSPADLTSPVSFPVAGGIGLEVLGAARMAADRGCERVALIRQGVVTTELLDAFAAAGLATSGMSLSSVVVLPPGPDALTPQVAEATRDSDCLVIVSAEQNTQRVLAAYQELGATQRLFTVGGGHSARVAAQFPEIGARTYRADALPPISNTVWREYLEAIARSPRAATVEVEGTLQRLTWASYEVFARVARELTNVTAESMLAALRSTTELDTDGLTPSLTFTEELPVPGLNRFFNTQLSFQRFSDGRFVGLEPGFVDLRTELALVPRFISQPPEQTIAGPPTLSRTENSASAPR